MLLEDTLMTLGKLTQFIERAAAFKGRTRERLVALSEAEELFFRLYPGHYRALQTIRMVSQLGRPAYKREVPIQRCESRLVRLIMDILIDALRCGDLALRPHRRPEEVAFTLWALAFGTRALMDSRIAYRQLRIEDAIETGRQTMEMLLDSLGWIPLSDSWNYEATRRIVRGSIFAEEWEELARTSAHMTPPAFLRRVEVQGA
jgi:hypothetical protein